MLYRSSRYRPDLRRPIRELSADKLESYAWHAMKTVGSAADYLYFLPRVLELHVVDGLSFFDVEVTAGAVAATDRLQWSHEERDALDQFLMAVFHHSLAPDRHWAIDGWLCFAAQTDGPFELMLASLERFPRAVFEVFSTHSVDVIKQRLLRGFWDRVPLERRIRFLEWLSSDRVRELVLAA